MPRFARVVMAGCPHHITHRGNRRGDVFFSDEDRQEYMEILLEYAARYKVDILAYCLMTNHTHLIAVPESEESLGLTIGRTHMKYARHANKRQEWWGHLWANRYYSTPLDEKHCLEAVKYVERNPVRAGLVERPWDYPWSSAQGHVGGDPHPVLKLDYFDSYIRVGAPWAEWLAGEEDEDMLTQLRANTSTGWPTGGPEFITRLEERLGRRLVRSKPGRKPKDGRNT